MRFHLVSDNEDTLVGMRLAGVDGVLVKEPELAQKAINRRRCGYVFRICL